MFQFFYSLEDYSILLPPALLRRFINYPLFESAYRQHHSTETALLRVMNDILLKMNCKHIMLLVLLDLSAAFHAVTHDVLLDHLHNEVGLCGNALN